MHFRVEPVIDAEVRAGAQREILITAPRSAAVGKNRIVLRHKAAQSVPPVRIHARQSGGCVHIPEDDNAFLLQFKKGPAVV